MKATTVLAMAAGVACLGSTAAAQSVERTRHNAELVSEMWAMAGICSQYPAHFQVRNEDLADWLNAEISGHDQAQVITEGREAKLTQISQTTQQLVAMRRGADREERTDRNAAALMTRCRALANNPVAGEYFLRRRG